MGQNDFKFDTISGITDSKFAGLFHFTRR